MAKIIIFFGLTNLCMMYFYGFTFSFKLILLYMLLKLIYNSTPYSRDKIEFFELIFYLLHLLLHIIVIYANKLMRLIQSIIMSYIMSYILNKNKKNQIIKELNNKNEIDNFLDSLSDVKKIE